MNELTRRSMSQVIFRHTPRSLIALDEFDGIFGYVAVIKGYPDTDVDKKILHRHIYRFVENWKNDSDGRVRGYDIDNLEPSSLIAIRPEGRVLWDFMPSILFECLNNKCKVISNSTDNNFNGQCIRCGSGLKQFRYVMFHSCGYMRPFVLLRQVSCPTHFKKFLYLNDTGRFQSSTWRCRECNYEKGLGMLQCPDEICKRKTDADSKKYLRASVWNDPWVYFTQVITFVNLNEDEIRPVLESEIKEQLLLGSYLNIIPAGNGNLKNKAEENLKTRNCIKCGYIISLKSKFCNNCGEKQPDLISNNDQNEPSKMKINQALISEDSDLVNFSAIRDLERSISLKDKNRDNEGKSDLDKIKYIKDNLTKANNLGFEDIIYIGDFPLTYAALGYSRFQSKPPTWLSSFPPLNSNETKIPVYTNCVTTEALMVQLSAKYLAKWLQRNKFYNFSDELINDEAKLKIWFLEFMIKECDSDKDKNIQSIIKELIHSVSHTYLQSLSLESGLDVASFGELQLPNSLSFIIYAGENDVGGISATFIQGLNVLLDTLSDQMRLCKFDPSCTEDDDGACVGCIYLPRGCVHFNENLSRSYIYGGKTTNLSAKNIPIGFFDLVNS